MSFPGGVPPMRPDQALQPVSRSGTGPAPQEGIVTARRVIVSGPGEGIFSYSPSPGPDNLIASTGIAMAGTDSYGNNYLRGDTVYGPAFGIFFAMQLDSAGAQWFIGGVHQSSSYTQIANFGSSILHPGVGYGFFLGATPALVVSNAAGAANFRQLWLSPSGDTSGVQDSDNLNSAISNSPKMRIMCLPGDWYFNVGFTNGGFTVGVELTKIGGQLIGAGSNDSPASNNSKTVFHMANGANLDSMFATTGWLENTNTTVGQPWLIDNIYFDGNSANQTGGANHLLTLQTHRTLIRNCVFANTLLGGDAVRYDYFCHDGVTHITNTGEENRIYLSTFRQIGGIPVRTTDPLNVSGLYTDGHLMFCTIAPGGTLSPNDAVLINHSAGWQIGFNHLYAMNAGGIHLFHAGATRVIGNDVDYALDSFLSAAVAGTYSGISMEQCNAPSLGNTIQGNVVSLRNPPPVGSLLYGIYGSSFASPSAEVDIAVTGNTVNANVVPATDGLRYENLGAGTLNVASTGNQVKGWTNQVHQVPGAGVINLNAGV